MALEKTKYVSSTTENSFSGSDKKVTRSASAEQRQAKNQEVIGYVKGVQNLNVREKPSSEANVLTTIPMTTAVTVKGDVGDYYRIVTPDLTEGFVLKGFLEVKR